MDDRRVETAAQTGLELNLGDRLSGGEQEGAYLVTVGDGRQLVLKLQPDLEKAQRLVRAAPVMARAVADGWPAAAWLNTGLLRDGTGYLLQEYVDGQPIDVLDSQTMQAILDANSRQTGLGLAEAVDDSAQLDAVVAGDHPWRALVAGHSRRGAALVRDANKVLERLGPARLNVHDVVHGDYSTSNMILTREGEVRFIDCETVGRGTRVRDLADLYRQCIVYPGTSPDVMQTLRDQACAVAGPAVFAKCLIAVSYNNLAWWVENRSLADFDDACERVGAILDGLTPAAD